MGAAQRGGSSRRPKWFGLLAVVLASALGGLYRAANSPATSAVLLQPVPAAAGGASSGGSGQVPAEDSSSAAGEEPETAAPVYSSSAADDEPAIAAPVDGGGGGGGGGGKGGERRDDGRDPQDDAASAAALSVDAAERARLAGATAAAELAAPALGQAGGDADGGAGPRLPQAPKVALMFLTRGPLPFNRTWDWWMNDVDGVLPSHSLAALGCGKEQVELVRQLRGGRYMNSTRAFVPLYWRQHLYSIYVHSQPSYASKYELDSVFHGRRAKVRVETSWGTHSLVTAVRSMLREALQDPLNQRFLLLSESDMPLWPAGLLYLQLMSEPRSRVLACAPRSDVERKHNLQNGEDKLLGIPASMWRKSSQWIALTRHHAQLVVEDKALDARFAKDCYVRRDLVTWKWRDGDRWCVSDEHYVATLLAMHGEEDNCTCTVPGGRASPTYTQWTGQPHPRTFTAAELTPETVWGVRGCDIAVAEAALRSYRSLLPSTQDWSQQACRAAAAQLAAGVAAGRGGDGDAAAEGVVGDAEDAGGAAGGGVPALLPQYMCRLVLRKVSKPDADAVTQAVRQGLLKAPAPQGVEPML